MSRRILTLAVILSLVVSVAAAPASQAPTTFKKIDFYVQEGEDMKDHDAQLMLDPRARLITFADEDKSSEVFAVVEWDRITGVSYENSKHARITAGLLVAWPMLFLKGRKHWLTITFAPGADGSPGGYVFARMDKGNFQTILAAINGFTGQEIRRIEENGEISVLYPGVAATEPPPPPPPAANPSGAVAKPQGGSVAAFPDVAETPPATSTTTPPPAVAASPDTESKPPKADAAPAATERISVGALPPPAAALSAPEKLSGSASWTARTASGVAYEWSAEIRNQNGEPMDAVVTIVLRASDGTALHTAQGAGAVPAGASSALSGTGAVEESVATRADHWTIDVAWGELEATPSGPTSVATTPTVAAPAPAFVQTSSVSLTVDLSREEARITNTGNTDVDLRGWELVSVTGNQRMKFATGFLNPGGSITVTSGARARNSPGYYQWTSRTVWDINGDPAELYDVDGNLRARTDASGKPRR